MILSNKAVCSSTTLPPTSTAAVVCTFMKVAESAPITKIPMMLAALASFSVASLILTIAAVPARYPMNIKPK